MKAPDHRSTRANGPSKGEPPRTRRTASRRWLIAAGALAPVLALVVAGVAILPGGSSERPLGEPFEVSVEAEVWRGIGGEPGHKTLAAHVATTLGTMGSFSLRCRRTDNTSPVSPVVARETKIIAIKVDSVTRTAVSG